LLAPDSAEALDKLPTHPLLLFFRHSSVFGFLGRSGLSDHHATVGLALLERRKGARAEQALNHGRWRAMERMLGTKRARESERMA